MDNLFLLFASFATSFVLSYISIPIIIKLAKKWNLLDEAKGRKRHKGKIPALGGLAVFAAFSIAGLIWIPFEQLLSLKFFFAATFVLVILGFRDDVVPLKSYQKLIGQIIVASILIFLGNIRLTSMYGILGIQEISYPYSYVLSVFTIVVIINAFNLIDGIDGLATVLGIIALSTFGHWFFVTKEPIFSFICFIVIGALVAFLRYNLIETKIFLGDTGSMLIGLTCATMAILFIEKNNALSYNNYMKINAGAAVAISAMIVPLLDCLRVFIIRIFVFRKSPFSPDRSHIHHMLERLQLSHLSINLILGVFTIFLICIANLFKYLGDFIVIQIIIGITLIAIIILNYIVSLKIKHKSN